MPHSISRVGDLITIRYSGDVDARDLEQANETLAEMTAGGESHRVLFDLTKIAGWQLNAEELRGLARLWEELFKEAKCERAAAVASKDLMYGDLRMVSSLLERLQVPRGVFRDESTARRWLDGEDVTTEGP